MTTADSRATQRAYLAQLLETSLVGVGLPVQAVYAYQVGDFQGQSPVVVVSSKSTEAVTLSFQGTRPRHEFNVHVFILYSDETGTWTEEDCENALDQIEAIIRQTVESNKRVANYWEALEHVGSSQTGSAVIGGVDYRTEVFTLRTN